MGEQRDQAQRSSENVASPVEPLWFSQTRSTGHAEQPAIALGDAMSRYDSTPVYDGTYSVSLSVGDGDNLLALTVNAIEEARLTIEETLTLIASLTGALSAMIANNA